MKEIFKINNKKKILILNVNLIKPDYKIDYFLYITNHLYNVDKK